MTDFRKALQNLRDERERANREVSELAKAIAVLEKLAGRSGRFDNGSSSAGRNRRTRRKISAAGRARIAAAQRARWAKVRQRKQTAKAA
jgi:hypothetical protein